MCRRTKEPPSYGSLNETPDISHFSYVEFGGEDGKTCPTCKGTGRITKGQEDELVALIPYNDQRLKPSRTKCYVLLAVVLSLLVCGLVLFFLLPRSVRIEADKLLGYKVVLYEDSATIVLKNQFTISNENYFDVKVTSLEVEGFFDKVSVGKGHLDPIPMILPARRTAFPVNVTITLNFTHENQLEYIVSVCTNPKRKVHDIVIKQVATQTTVYLQHSEQESLQTFKYVDCSANVVNYKRPSPLTSLFQPGRHHG